MPLLLQTFARTKTFDEGGVPGISPIPYESKPSPSTPTTPQVPGDRSSPDDPTANHLKEANEEFGRANQTVRDNIPNNTLPCGEANTAIGEAGIPTTLWQVADLYAYGAKMFANAGDTDNAAIAKDRMAKLLADVKRLRAANYCDRPDPGALRNYAMWFQHSAPQQAQPTQKPQPNPDHAKLREELKKALAEKEAKEKKERDAYCADAELHPVGYPADVIKMCKDLKK